MNLLQNIRSATVSNVKEASTSQDSKDEKQLASRKMCLLDHISIKPVGLLRDVLMGNNDGGVGGLCFVFLLRRLINGVAVRSGWFCRMARSSGSAH
jgi:hypothetical protein